MIDSTYNLIAQQTKLQRAWRHSLPNYPLPCYRDDGAYVFLETAETVDVFMRDNRDHARNNDKAIGDARKQEELGDVGRMLLDMILADESHGLTVVAENQAHAAVIDSLLQLAVAAIDARRTTDPHHRKQLLSHLIHRWVVIVEKLGYDPAQLLNDARAKQTRKHAPR